METCKSLENYFVTKAIKQEPDASANWMSNLSDNMRGNLNLQKYIYKEELDLKWDEKNYNYDEIYDNVDVNPIEQSKATMGNETTGFLPNERPEQSLINVKIENHNIEQAEINEHSDLQKYYYKEELDLDWDERDNYFDKTHETSIEMAVDNNRANEAETNTSTSDSRNKAFGSRTNIENPDTAKNCPKCKKQLKNLNTLKKHVYYCGKVPHLQCDSCSYKAKYKNALITHIIRNHPQQIPNFPKKRITQKKKNERNKILKEQQESDKCFRFCTNCNISTEQSKLNNCDKCKTWLLYQCRKCKETFDSRERLIRHILDICDPKGYFHCPACKFKATHKKDVKNHLRVHLIRRSELDIEAIKWKRVQERKDGSEESPLFECPSCGKQFQRQASLASHMRFCIKSQGVSKPPTHYVEKRDPGIKRMISKYCTKCNNKILSNALQSSECCRSSIIFQCLKCNKPSENIRTMYFHVKECCSIKQKCNLCNYEGSERNLALHRQSKHDFNRVECPKCKGIFKNKNTLRHHSYTCGKEPLKCDYCSFTYKRKHELNNHVFNSHQK